MLCTRRGSNCLFCLRELRSFEVCIDLLHMFYQTVTASSFFYAAVCLGGSMTDRNSRRLDKLVKKASSVISRRLDRLTTVLEQLTLLKLQAIMGSKNHPLHNILTGQRSRCSEQLTALQDIEAQKVLCPHNH